MNLEIKKFMENVLNLVLMKIEKKNFLKENKNVSGPMELKVDISLIKKLTGWRPVYSLEEGLEKHSI
tara:strand:+ start:510 stop:710 length:201 start_codon:yes stop_codon:yes gene_type:complete